ALEIGNGRIEPAELQGGAPAQRTCAWQRGVAAKQLLRLLERKVRLPRADPIVAHAERQQRRVSVELAGPLPLAQRSVHAAEILEKDRIPMVAFGVVRIERERFPEAGVRLRPPPLEEAQ